jgi:hypothetical protein
MYALDVALDRGGQLPQDVVTGVLEWLQQLIALNVDKGVTLSVDELILIAHALGDAIGEHVHPIPEVEESPAVKGGVLLRLDDPKGLMPELETALRNYVFLEAACCGKLAGLLNPQHVDPGYVPEFSCLTCGSSFVVKLIDGPAGTQKKALVRKEDA